MACEKTVHEADVVGNEETETEAEQAGGHSQAAVKPNEAPPGVRARDRDGRGDQHHARDGAHAEDEQVDDPEGGIADGGKHEQGDGSGSGQAMYDADNQGSEGMVQPKPIGRSPQTVLNLAIDLCERCGVFGVSVHAVSMAVEMLVRVVAVGMEVGVSAGHRGREALGDPAGYSGEIQDAEQNQHDADGQLHGETEPGRNDHVEQDDGGAHRENGESMPEAPEGTDQGSALNGSLPADDSGDGDHVIGIRGVPHAEHEANQRYRHQATHSSSSLESAESPKQSYQESKVESWKVKGLTPLSSAAYNLMRSIPIALRP